MRDRELIRAFEDGTLPPSSFRHRDHVHLAWLHLREAPLLEAMVRFSRTLLRYAASLGAASKYHETVTVAFVLLIHERMQHHSTASFEEFAEANPDLFGPILDRYYAPETLASERARSAFVLPDR